MHPSDEKGFVEWRADDVQAVCNTLNVRMDANETAMLLRDLDYIRTQTFDRKYEQLKLREFVPVDNSAPEGAEAITYRQWDRSGIADIIANHADDLPAVEAVAREFSVVVKSLGAAFLYSTHDVRAAAMSGQRLDEMRAMQARDAIERKIDRLGAFGDADCGFNGFTNHPNVPVLANGSGAVWSNASETYDEIVAELHRLANSIVETTREVEVPDTVILPTSIYNLIATTKFNTQTDKTVLMQFLDQSPYITNVQPWIQLENADAAGTGPRAIAYRRDPSVLAVNIPMEFTMYPPQAYNLAFKVPVEARFGGVEVRYPLAISYMDGI